MADSFAARLAALMLSPDNGAMVALAVEMAGRLDAIERDAMARRVVWASKKRTQRTRGNVPETLGDTGGQRGTSGDIPIPLPLASPTPTTTAKATTTTDPASQDVADKRHASRRGRAEARSTSVRQTWLSAPAEVWASRVGAFPFGEAARALKPLADAGIGSDEIATRLTAYLDELEQKGDLGFVSLSRFAKTHLRYAHGKPLSPQDAELQAIADEASGGYIFAERPEAA